MQDPSTPSRANGWAEIRRLAGDERGPLIAGALLMLVARASGLVLPIASKYLVDDVMSARRGELLVPIAAAAAVATVVESASSFLLTRMLAVAAQRQVAAIRKSVQYHIGRLPVRFFDGTQTGALVSRVMSDADAIRTLMGHGLTDLCGSAVTAALALVVLLWVSWRITLVNVTILAAFAATMFFAFERLRALYRTSSQLNAELTGRLAESFGGIRVVKAYVAERRERRVFATGIHRLFRNNVRATTAVAVVTSGAQLAIGLFGFVIVVLAGRAVVAGAMTIGDLFMYVFFVGFLAMPVLRLTVLGPEIAEALAGLDRIREIRRLATEDWEDETRLTVGEVRGEIVFDDVSFEYETGVPVLRQVSFRARAGSTTALVGPSGSGKSTLVSLVMAFHQPSAGRVLVDDVDLARLRRRDYREHLGVVLQDNFVFDGTVAENVRFARPRATAAEVEAAGRTAHCDDFVARLPKRYDTVVGERGVKLSGGQRQRVAIARAILADPRILILDEATSSLDSESEELIQRGLQALRHGRTTFVIAHRLSTIRTADQILVLDAGRIVEAGTHDELLACRGLYRRLYERQYRLEHDRFTNPGEGEPRPSPLASGAQLQAV